MDSLQVSDLMDIRPLTLHPEMGVITALRQILEKGLSAAPVVDTEGQLIGILSEADCIRGTLMGGYYEQVGELVSAQMTTDVCTVTSKTDLVSAAQLMLENKRRLLPVIDQGKVAGLLTRTAVLSKLIDCIDSQAHAA